METVEKLHKGLIDNFFIYAINLKDVDDKSILKDYIKSILDGQEFYIRDLFDIIRVDDRLAYFDDNYKENILNIVSNIGNMVYPWDISNYVTSGYLKYISKMVANINKGTYYSPPPSNETIRRSKATSYNRRIFKKIVERDGYFCRLCKTDKNLTVDHIIPISKGGKDKLDNCQLLCKSCNSGKGARC